jgi:shikimate dehydrogenase
MSERTIRGAVLGSPISHSLSPVLHNKAFDLLGLSGRYEAIEVESGALATFLKNHGADFDYLSLTMPLKEEVFEIANELKIEID